MNSSGQGTHLVHSMQQSLGGRNLEDFHFIFIPFIMSEVLGHNTQIIRGTEMMSIPVFFLLSYPYKIEVYFISPPFINLYITL